MTNEVGLQRIAETEASGLQERIAELTETLTRPRYHTFCGETHVPGPCNDGVTRPDPVLVDLADRMRRADRELRDMALGAIGTTARDRLAHKAQGVALALSYVEEALRAR